METQYWQTENEMFGIYFGTLHQEKIEQCQAECSNYNELQIHIGDMDELDLLRCLWIEKNTRKRANIMNRLFTRFQEVRKNKERLQLYRD